MTQNFFLVKLQVFVSRTFILLCLLNIFPLMPDEILFCKKPVHPRFTKKKSNKKKKLMKQWILQSQDCFTAHQGLIINLQEEEEEEEGVAVLTQVAVTPQQLI